MKFSLKWLQEWLPVTQTPQEVAELLSMAGLEVDSIKPVAGEFSDVVIGQVNKITQHPNADRLRVCEVDVGTDTALQIVCGASNVCEQAKVPVAMIGAVLPGNFKIKKSKLRGVESEGMICSEKELGIADESTGIWLLPSNAPIGQNLREYLQLDDVVIEVDLTPNRGDCLSIQGIARELAALTQQNLHSIEFNEVSPTNQQTFPTSITAQQDCPRYVTRVIKNVNAQATTPLWMQEKLRRCDMRSIHPIVDVTNYVMLELGQPLHAFDLEKIAKKIIVRHAEKGESITLLDGNTVNLDENHLLIADENSPLALAGIMGGADSAVNTNTQNILLESAFFAPEQIAGKARELGLHTDSSHRFERGVDPQLQLKAIERATQLLLEIVGGEAGPVTHNEQTAYLPKSQQINLRQQRVEKMLGLPISNAEVERILQSLEMQLSATTQGWQVTVPSYRSDITREIDLIEEIARIYGYDNIPATMPELRPCNTQLFTSNNHQRLRLLLADRGYAEAFTYSFIDSKLQQLLDPEQTALRLLNPISSMMDVMRTSLWPGLIQGVLHNQHRQQSRVRLFEIGRCFLPDGRALLQDRFIAGVVSGRVNAEQWADEGREVDFFDVKADVEALLQLSGISTQCQFRFQPHPALHPGQSAAILLDNIPIGYLGALHPALHKHFDFNASVFLFEINLEQLANTPRKKYQAISKFPAIRRDIALVVDNNTPVSTICDSVRTQAGKLLQEIVVFDIYQGAGLAAGKKSIALGLTLQDSSRTLIDNEVNKIMDEIIATLQTNFNATLRN
jgi:phenylalanyl-tRNA synthetase beta chain